MDSSIAKLIVIDSANAVQLMQYRSDQMRELIVNLENEVIANAAKDYVKVFILCDLKFI